MLAMSTGSAEGCRSQAKMWQLSAHWNGGAEGDRTPDLVIANDALSQLSYGPVPVRYGTVSAEALLRAAPLAKRPLAWKTILARGPRLSSASKPA